nr:hypothetical protein [Cressdnaviricota sp.]UOF81225.1 hypothetical protein [Cressdnaviricota sp.]
MRFFGGRSIAARAWIIILFYSPSLLFIAFIWDHCYVCVRASHRRRASRHDSNGGHRYLAFANADIAQACTMAKLRY